MNDRKIDGSDERGFRLEKEFANSIEILLPVKTKSFVSAQSFKL